MTIMTIKLTQQRNMRHTLDRFTYINTYLNTLICKGEYVHYYIEMSWGFLHQRSTVHITCKEEYCLKFVVFKLANPGLFCLSSFFSQSKMVQISTI